MADHIPHDLNARILTLVAARGEGIMLSDIEKELGTLASRRTVSRRLGELLETKQLQRLGTARSAIYLPKMSRSYAINPLHAEYAMAEPRVVYAEEDIELSPEAQAVRKIFRDKGRVRRPVPYCRSFLEDYEPNKTWYLSQSHRELLWELDVFRGATLPIGTYGRELMSKMLIDLSWASSRLEGNTYSRLDTRRLIEFGETAAGKDADEARMILNHKEAIEFLIGGGEEIGLNASTLSNLHTLLAQGIIPDDRDLGRVRRSSVGVSGTLYRPLDAPQVLEELLALILSKANAISDVFEASFFLLVHIPYLQAFRDVNKRLSRVAANIPLVRNEMCPLSFVDVPVRVYVDSLLSVYELNRIEPLRDVFVWAYRRSCEDYQDIHRNFPPPDPFRTKYRPALTEVISDIVRGLQRPTADTIQALAIPIVQPQDLEKFVELTLHEFDILFEGNIARFKLRQSEYNAWKAATSQKPV